MKKVESIKDDLKWNELRDKVLLPKANIFEYERASEKYLLKTKYIPELRLHLLVEAKVDDFIDDVKKTFYFNLSLSLLVTLIVAIMILMTIKRYNHNLAYIAEHDPLTGLYNRRSFQELLERYHKLSKRNSQALSLVFLDIDNFKEINDKYGHYTGDKVLQRFAELLRTHLRETDLIARWGGEEFLIALSDTELEYAHNVAEKVRTIVTEDFILHQLLGVKSTASFGVTEFKMDETMEDVIARADKAMYKAKHTGKNKVLSV